MKMEAIINRINSARMQRGITLEEWASLANLSKSTVWELQSGKDIRVSTLLAAANALGLTLTITEKL